MHGSYQTTRPQTEPPAEALPFAQGDRVQHERFGPGKVLEIDNDIVLVDFAKGGSRRLRAAFLSAA